MLGMNILFVMLGHLLLAIAKLVGGGGARALVAENLLLKQQLIVLNRGRCRAPRIRSIQKLLLGFLSSFIRPRRLAKSTVVPKPSTLFRIHRLFVNSKYRELFTPKKNGKPGPKGPERELIDAVVEFKKRNPRCGYIRIAQQISTTFGVEVGQDVVRRILAQHYKPTSEDDGPSWLTVLAQCKDSLWSVDFFRTESIHLKTHWVMVVMDQYSRRIIGFSVQPIALHGEAVCRMFNEVLSHGIVPKRLSSDNDPLFKFKRWQANIRILEIGLVKSIPYVPISHPFVERLISTIRRELLDHTFYWTAADLQKKLDTFRDYYNEIRVHQGIEGKTPKMVNDDTDRTVIELNSYRWKSHCNGLFEMPEAA
jgi:transposase InsO family protein